MRHTFNSLVKLTIISSLLIQAIGTSKTTKTHHIASTNIRILQKNLKVATFEGSFESNTFVYTLICRYYNQILINMYCIGYWQTLGGLDGWADLGGM